MGSEMSMRFNMFYPRRSPHGERGLKSITILEIPERVCGRSPHGERGLKLHLAGDERRELVVAPRMGSVD